ncbi:hypothetical protein CVV38_01640 [Candidatus Peregrinibacteria bacterium HGW-Peregrinibacteria-1]|jgi:hypothetical protein|nr:MAG: hypothetical protein CVV38_01640 [Candidatus Peregrinibacteria bacterium HGW-Peregrinibacteria-1]
MFITLTIDTNTLSRNGIRMKKRRRVNTAQSWRKAVHVSKRSMWDKMRAFRRDLREKHYGFGVKVRAI